MPLTDSKLRAIMSASAPKKTYDGGGLHVLVTPKGTLLWHMDYRYGGKRKTLSLGEYPTVSLSQARLLREKAKEMLSKGEDPGAAKREEKKSEVVKSRTFKDVACEWHEMKKGEWSKKHGEVVMMRLEKHVFPGIGRIPVAELRTSDVLSVLRGIEAAYTARRISGLVAQVCDYAHICEYCEANVAAGLTKTLPKHVEEHRAALLDPARIGDYLARVERSASYRQMRYALRLLPYLFLRNSELRKGEWSEVDLDAGLWTVPARRMKMDRDHVVPLARQVVEIFRDLRRPGVVGPLIFPSSIARDKPISDGGLLNALRALGYGREEVTVHGFRATASTFLNGMGFHPDVVEAQLAHKDPNKIRAAYNRNEYLDQRREMMQAWADYLDELREKAGGGR